MNFGWLTILLKLAPYIVGGVETIAGENASGATKKQMATDALNIATQGALAVEPVQDEDLTQAVSSVTGMVINSTVQTMTANGTLPAHKLSTSDPASPPAIATSKLQPAAAIPAAIQQLQPQPAVAIPAAGSAGPAGPELVPQHTGAPA
jgi:hypothetical protein